VPSIARVAAGAFGFFDFEAPLFGGLRRGFLSLGRAINHTLLHASRLTGDKVVVGRYAVFCATIFLA